MIVCLRELQFNERFIMVLCIIIILGVWGYFSFAFLTLILFLLFFMCGVVIARAWSRLLFSKYCHPTGDVREMVSVLLVSNTLIGKFVPNVHMTLPVWLGN